MTRQRLPFEEAVVALSNYFVGTATMGDSLAEVARRTIDALPQSKHVGVTLLVEGKLTTSVFSHPEVAEMDRTQYETGDGPCVDAFREGRIHVIGSTETPGRWQAFRASAFHHGILSTLSLPLTTGSGRIGALNLYSAELDAYDEQDESNGALFATLGAFLLHNAQAYWDARTLTDNLNQAMVSRSTIEQAKGIVMGSTGCTPDEAFELLVRQSKDQNVKLRDIAEELVRNAQRHR
jgi:GAF domain-containing protein